MSVLQIILLVVVALTLVGSFAYLTHIVPQAKAYVIERLGAYRTIWNTGIHILAPSVDRVSNKMTLEEVVENSAPQLVTTEGNITMQIGMAVYSQITDSELYTYGIVGPITATENLIATTLRDTIDDLELDKALTLRDIINTKIHTILNEATDPWGIKVSRVEVENVVLPRDIQETMEKQMCAERERRESILRAEGEKRGNILATEGEKEAMVLHTSTRKGAMIAEAEGQARAVKRICEAQARDVEMVKNANPTKEYLSLKNLEICGKMADDKATKIVVPGEIQNMASFLTSARETLTDDAAKDVLEEVIRLKEN